MAKIFQKQVKILMENKEKKRISLQEHPIKEKCQRLPNFNYLPKINKMIIKGKNLPRSENPTITI